MLWNCSHDATTIGGGIVLKTADTYVRARIDSETKEQASEALAAMGLSISDAIRSNY